MPDLMTIVSHGFGTLFGLFLVAFLLYWLVYELVQKKYLRAANYAINMNKEIDMIAHSCGLRHARELRREHVRIVETAGKSVALNIMHPYPEAREHVDVSL